MVEQEPGKPGKHEQKAQLGKELRSNGSSGDNDLNDGWVESVRLRIVDWYRQGRRDLPWRIDRDPYRILVSEMMLVQTTVAAVVPYFERFLHLFPDPGSLASADETEVLKAWEGLGYYRRARQLHAAARRIVERHGGKVPDDPVELRALPGVGRYMAGAILSFAYDRPAAILEANTQRVLARLLAWTGDLKTAHTQNRLWLAAERLVPPEGAGDFNQGLMELGAIVCRPREPGCLVCPVSDLCAARALGRQNELPVISPKPPPLAVTEACVVVVKDARLLIVRRGSEGLWADFWEFPTLNLTGADPAGRAFETPVDLTEGLRRLTGIRAEIGERIKTLTYTVTKHRVTLHVHSAKEFAGSLTPSCGLVDARWVAPGDLADYPLGSAARKLSTWIVREPDRIVIN
jgi:A/G-specific adenine glycosylase